MNKCRSSKIPPILVNNKFIINCKDKATLFAEFFSQQCKPVTNNSILPIFNFVTESRFDTLNISDAEIVLLMRRKLLDLMKFLVVCYCRVMILLYLPLE